MKSIYFLSKIYFLFIYLAGAAVLSFHLPNADFVEPAVFLSLCFLGAIFHILKVEGATRRSHFTFSFLIFGFALIFLPPSQALIVILVSNVAEWAWVRPPWFVQLFKIGCYFISAQAAILIYERLNLSRDFASWKVVPATVLAMMGFTLVNQVLVSVALWLARGKSPRQSGVFALMPLAINVIMLISGASLVLVWHFNPYALVLFLAPLYPIYISMKIPALERKTVTDQKTGLFNHQYFMEHLRSELRRASRNDLPLSIIMADLDLLRNINNTYGHLAGDEVLKAVADILKRSVRASDVVARFGGEEFAILMPETKIETAIERVEYIRRKIENARFRIPTSNQPIQVTLSMGVAMRDTAEQTAEEIIHNADTALYNSKLKGRNRAYAYMYNTFRRVETGPTNAVRAVATRPVRLPSGGVSSFYRKGN